MIHTKNNIAHKYCKIKNQLFRQLIIVQITQMICLGFPAESSIDLPVFFER